ncbi:MAG TPA: hypothetical protein VI072_01605 [Polyangiaceae bacterium]
MSRGVVMAFSTPVLVRRLVADRRGAVSVEYLVLLATMGMVVAFAIVGFGPALVQSFSFTRALIISPTP